MTSVDDILVSYNMARRTPRLARRMSYWKMDVRRIAFTGCSYDTHNTLSVPFVNIRNA
jgi:hypothetical protein